MRFIAFILLATLTAFAAGGCKKKADNAGSGDGANTLDDKARLQGAWTITAIDFPDDLKGGERKSFEVLKELAITVADDRITVTHSKEKGSVTATFTLNAANTPKEVDASRFQIDDKQNPDEGLPASRGIYKFEGDELIIAAPFGRGKDLPRPMEFTPSANVEKRQAVLVLHLKKK